MFARLVSLLLFACAGAVSGWYWISAHPEQDVWLVLALAVMGGLCLWLLFDAWRGLRVVAWLRRGDFTTPAQTLGQWGLWGQVQERLRRIARDHHKALTQSQQQLQDFLSAIQASPNGVLMLDAQGQIEWCNQTAAVQLGLDAQRDLGQRITNLLRQPEFVAYMHSPDVQAPVVVEGRMHQPNRPVRIAIQRHGYGDGKQLLLTRDVTTLEQAEAMRRDFVANVSHEIRTPLTVLSGFVETLQTLDVTQAERQRYLQMMATQAQRMQTLVADLLTLSKLEASPEPSLETAMVLGDWLEATREEAVALSAQMVPNEAAHRIHVTIDVGLQNAVVLGTVQELQSALSNLMSNAVRYTPAGGSIALHARVASDGCLELLVQDSGPGIATEHLPRLTERFYRVDRSRSRETGGTGLGLAIVKHVMQRHGGSLQVSSVVGQGSCFSLRFPAQRWRQSDATA